MTRFYLLANVAHLETSHLFPFESHHMKKYLKDNKKRKDLTVLSNACCFEIIIVFTSSA